MHIEVAQADPRPPQLLFDHRAYACSLLHDDKRLGAKLVERQRFTGKGVPGWADEHDLVAEERLEGD